MAFLMFRAEPFAGIGGTERDGERQKGSRSSACEIDRALGITKPTTFTA